jgi:hypothetical protein
VGLPTRSVLQALLVGDSFKDLDYNTQLFQLKLEGSTTLVELEGLALEIVAPSAEAATRVVALPNLILVSLYVSTRQLELAAKHANKLEGTDRPAFVARTEALQSLANGKRKHRPRPASTIHQSVPSETGGWDYDQVGEDPADGDSNGEVDYLPAAEVLAGGDAACCHLSRPTVIGVGLFDSWPARQSGGWSKDGLITGPRSELFVQASIMPNGGQHGHASANITIREFIRLYMSGEQPNALPLAHPLYIFEQLPDPALRGRADDALGLLTIDYTIPHPLKPPSSWREANAFQLPPQQHFYLGPKGSGSHFNQHGATFNALVHGQKRWIRVPPEHGYTLRKTFARSNGKTMPIQDVLRTGLAELKAVGCDWVDVVQQQGEIIYVPDGWQHADFNLADSVGVSYQLGLKPS